MKKWLLRAVLLLTGGAILGVFVWRAQAVPEGPHTVVWDKETCAECGMKVSVREYACQLQTVEGRTFHFDDPGCLFIYLLANRPVVRAVYFHAMDSDRWLSRDEVAFAKSNLSPMGYELGAVPRGTPGALSFDQAMEKIRQLDKEGQ